MNNMLRKSVLALCFLSITACAQEEEKMPEPRKDLMPFTISFKLDGAPVLLDESGREIEPKQIEYPLHATAIERIDTLTLVQAKGSHYKLIKLNGKEYYIPLKH